MELSKKYQANELSPEGLEEQVSTLLGGNPELLAEFRLFFQSINLVSKWQ